MPAKRKVTYEGEAHVRAGSGGGADPPELSAAEAGSLGLRVMTGLTGKSAEGVTLVEPSDDGWLVGVEIVEDRRIPSSGDVLALYEVSVDMVGTLLSYRRVRRYKRGSSDAVEGAK